MNNLKKYFKILIFKIIIKINNIQKPKIYKKTIIMKVNKNQIHNKIQSFNEQIFLIFLILKKKKQNKNLNKKIKFKILI